MEALELGFLPQRKEASTMARPLKYPPDMRERAVRLVHDSGRPISHVAKDLGVGEESLRKWVKQDELDRGRRTDGPLLAFARKVTVASHWACPGRCRTWAMTRVKSPTER
jgi:transposase-like protein